MYRMFYPSCSIFRCRWSHLVWRVQGLGKQVGPNHGWSFTSIISYGLFFAGILVHMTLSVTSQIYNIYHFLSWLKIKRDTIYFTTRDTFFWDTLTWSHYLIAPLYRILIIIWCELIYDITIAPIYFWKLWWYPNGRSIWQILSDPKGGPGRYETKIKPDDTKFRHQTQYNFTNKQRSQKRRNKGRNNGLNTNNSRFVLLRLSRGLDANVSYDEGFGDFFCNNIFRYQARSDSKEMKRHRKGWSKGRNIEVEPIKGYRSNLYKH